MIFILDVFVTQIFIYIHKLYIIYMCIYICLYILCTHLFTLCMFVSYPTPGSLLSALGDEWQRVLLHLTHIRSQAVLPNRCLALVKMVYLDDLNELLGN